MDNGPVPQGSFQDSCVAGDFGGTGRTSIACYTGPSGRWQVGLSTGSGWSLSNWDTGAAPALPIRNSCVTGNFSGDSKTGVACYTGGSGKWLVALSSGSGWSASFWDGGPDPALPVALLRGGQFQRRPKNGNSMLHGKRRQVGGSAIYRQALEHINLGRRPKTHKSRRAVCSWRYKWPRENQHWLFYGSPRQP
jgi:hypothetical protein